MLFNQGFDQFDFALCHPVHQVCVFQGCLVLPLNLSSSRGLESFLKLVDASFEILFKLPQSLKMVVEFTTERGKTKLILKFLSFFEKKETN
jgi:hypothetical protein